MGHELKKRTDPTETPHARHSQPANAPAAPTTGMPFYARADIARRTGAAAPAAPPTLAPAPAQPATSAVPLATPATPVVQPAAPPTAATPAAQPTAARPFVSAAAAPMKVERDDEAPPEASPASDETEDVTPPGGGDGATSAPTDDLAGDQDTPTNPQLVRAQLDDLAGELANDGAQARQTIEHASDQGAATLEARAYDASARVSGDVRTGLKRAEHLFGNERETWSRAFEREDGSLQVGSLMRQLLVIVRGVGTVLGISGAVVKAREDVETEIGNAIQRVDDIKVKQQNELHRRTAQAASDARKVRDDKRAQVHDAEDDLRAEKKEKIEDIGTDYAQALETQEPAGKAAIADGLADLPKQIRAEGDHAIEQLVDPSAQIGPPIAQAALATNTVIRDQTTAARKDLGELRDAALGALATGEQETRKGLEKIGAAARAQIQRSLRRSRKALRRNNRRLIEEVAGAIDQAIAMLGGSPTPELRRARRFVAWLGAQLTRTTNRFVDTLPSVIDALSRSLFDLAEEGGRRIQTSLHDAETGLSVQRAMVISRIAFSIASINTAIDETQQALFTILGDTKKEADGKLATAVAGMKAKFKAALDDADVQLAAKVKETFDKVDAKLPELGDKINDALSDIDWHHNHPVLSRLEDAGAWVLGFAWSAIKWLAKAILMLIGAVLLAIGIALLLGVSLAFGLVLVAVAGVALLGYSIYSATKNRIEEAKEKGIDRGFGTSLLMGASDVAGFTAMYRSFTVKGLTPFQRGSMFAEGLGDLAGVVLTFEGLKGSISSWRLNAKLAPLDYDPAKLADLKGMDKIDAALKMKAKDPAEFGRVARGKAALEGIGDLAKTAIKNPRKTARDVWDTMWGKRAKSKLDAQERARLDEQERLARQEQQNEEAKRAREREEQQRREEDRARELEEQRREEAERQREEQQQRAAQDRIEREERDRAQRAREQLDDMRTALDGQHHGRDMLRIVREKLAAADAMTPAEKADAFEALEREIHARDPSWQARRGPAVANGKPAAGLFTGEGRPFGFLIDAEGNIWQAMDLTPSIKGFGSDGLIIDLAAMRDGKPVWSQVKPGGPGVAAPAPTTGGPGAPPVEAPRAEAAPRVAPTATPPIEPAHVDAVIEAIKQSGQVTGDLDALAKVARDAKLNGEAGDGARGELEALRRWVADGKKIKVRTETQNQRHASGDTVKNPDYEVDGVVTEVKTRTKAFPEPGEVGNKSRDNWIRKQITEANKQVKRAAPEEPAAGDATAPQRQVELQLRSDANLGLAEIEAQVAEAFNSGRGRGLNRVAVYKDGQLFGEWVRQPDGSVIRTFPGSSGTPDGGGGGAGAGGPAKTAAPLEPGAVEPTPTIDIQGLAQAPKTLPWAPNAGGVVRTPAEAVAIARANGVVIPDDIRFAAVDPKRLPPDALAQYYARRFNAADRVSWQEFYNLYDEIAVKLSRDILASDEAITAVIAHEMHELNGLREIFATRETIPAEELANLINPGRKGNLHDQAWDVADAVVKLMRARRALLELLRRGGGGG